MVKLIYKIIIISFILSIGFSEKIKEVSKGDNFTKLRFNFEKPNKDIISELPSFSLNLNPNEEVDNINTYIFYQYNGEINVSIDSFDYEFTNGSSENIPTPQIIVSEYGKFRGYSFYKINIFPITETIDYKIIYNSIDFTVNEVEASNLEIETRKNSLIFEKMANQISINNIREINTNYQKPAILYITGGSSGSNPSFQELKNWKKKKGFEVYEVSTSTIGSSNVSNIKNYIQQAYNEFDPAPEYICLIGDDGGEFNIDSYTEFYSGYNGEGDHPFSQLDGNDILPDVLLGRISIRTFDHLNTIIQKILFYEQGLSFNISNFDNSWIERAALIGDPYPSGNSTIITNEYIRETILSTGFNEVISNYGENDIDSWMVDAINNGVSYINYRGWWGVSGFSQDEVNSLTNSLKLPFATFITCGTGSFSEHDNSLIESIVRSGTPNNPTGAIAAIGTSTSGTHTAYNNIVDMGIYHGIFALDGHSAGEALTYGKLALLNTYPNDPNNVVTIFSHWNNLIGDPSLQLWTKNPTEIHLEFSHPLNSGSHSYNIYVKDIDGNPIENARLVFITNGDNEVLNDITNEDGLISANITIGHGEIQMYVTGPNLIPLEEEILIEEDVHGIYVNLESIYIYDSNGLETQTIQPAEQYTMQFPCVNIGSEHSGYLSTYLISPHPEISIYQDTLIIPGIAQFSQLDIGPFNFEISSNIYNGEQIPLIFIIEDENQNSWSSIYNLSAHSYHPQVFHNNQNGIIEKGEFKEDFNFIIRNDGVMSISNLKAEISYTGDELDINTGILNLNNLSSGGEIISPNFNIFASNFNLNGIVVNVPVHIFNESGYNQTEFLKIQIGNIEPTDPTGPDQNGYFIFGTEDEYFESEWIEIDPFYGGYGENLNLIDAGNGVGNQANTITNIELPFEFLFYNESYNNITVSSNGWIAFGETNLSSFRNYPVPGPGGPKAMVSAFWDDLKAEDTACEDGFISDCSNDLDCCSINWVGDGWQDCEEQYYGCDLSCYSEEIADCEGINQPLNAKELSGYAPYERSNYGGAVIYYNDIENNRVIIEWSDMKTFFQNDEEDFQIILYPTDNNDGEIVINYKTFNNTSIGDYESQTPLHGQFATIGIEDKFQTDGLQYTFNNNYSSGAGLLNNNNSILITKYYYPYNYTAGDLNSDQQINVLDIIYIVSLIMNFIESSPQLNELGDVNSDYNLNVNDIVFLVNIILNN